MEKHVYDTCIFRIIGLITHSLSVLRRQSSEEEKKQPSGPNNNNKNNPSYSFSQTRRLNAFLKKKGNLSLSLFLVTQQRLNYDFDLILTQQDASSINIGFKWKTLRDSFRQYQTQHANTIGRRATPWNLTFDILRLKKKLDWEGGKKDRKEE